MVEVVRFTQEGHSVVDDGVSGPVEDAFKAGHDDPYEAETRRRAGFLDGLRDLCNLHRVGVQGDSDDSFATLWDLGEGETIVRIRIGSWGALQYEMEPKAEEPAGDPRHPDLRFHYKVEEPK